MPPKAAAPAEPELPPPLPSDVPAGGLDVPSAAVGEDGVPKAAAEIGQDERLEGESRLTKEERDRWLILHFALPRTIMTCDVAEGRSTEAELNDVLSIMAWGTIDAETSEWTPLSDEPSLEPPALGATPAAAEAAAVGEAFAPEAQEEADCAAAGGGSPDDKSADGSSAALVSYAEYVRRLYPIDASMDEAAREHNERLAAERRAAFTSPGEPGVALRPAFDLMVKSLAHSNKALMKAYDIKKPILKEEDQPEDEHRPVAHNIMRYGRHQILPSFWHLLSQLTKSNRRFSVVLHTFSDEQLSMVQQELRLYCQGQHPAYDGKNKTQKPPPMSGDKGSRDLRLLDGCIGRVDRAAGRLEFTGRPAGDSAKTARPGEAASIAAPAPAGDAAGAAPSDAEEGEGAEGEPAFSPTVYSFPPFHEAYAGLQHQVLNGANTAAIVEDSEHWRSKRQDPSAGQLLLVDATAEDIAETQVQHIFFDGYGRRRLEVRNVVSGELLPWEAAEGVFAHRVDLYQAATDVDYFARAVVACEMRFSQRLLASRRVSALGGVGAGAAAAAAEPAEGRDRALPPKEYLYRNIIPALLPALEACQRDRPADPVEFIAFYMLRHSQGYSKTLRA